MTDTTAPQNKADEWRALADWMAQYRADIRFDYGVLELDDHFAANEAALREAAARIRELDLELGDRLGEIGELGESLDAANARIRELELDRARLRAAVGEMPVSEITKNMTATSDLLYERDELQARIRELEAALRKFHSIDPTAQFARLRLEEVQNETGEALKND